MEKTYKCEVCGQDFTVYKKYVYKYCSDKCRKIRYAETGHKRWLEQKEKEKAELKRKGSGIEAVLKKKGDMSYGEYVAREYMKQHPFIRKDRP